MARPPIPLREKLLKSIEKTPTCWIWKAGLNAYGYGQLNHGGRPHGTHRLMWTLVNGAIPNGLCVLHKCDVRPCCNPEHLFLGTRTENSADKVSKNRQAKGNMLHPRRGEYSNKSKLTAEQVLAIRARCARGDNQRETARQYGITQAAVSSIHRQINWNHI